MLEFIYSLDNLHLGLFCLWLGYGVSVGFRNVLVGCYSTVKGGTVSQALVGQYFDILFVCLTLYLGIIYFK